MFDRIHRLQPMTGLKVLVFVLALLPLGLLFLDIKNGALGPDPGQAITESLGLAAFQLLLITLLISPLKKLTGWAGWVRLRRMLGLFSFFYASLHVLVFLQLILGWGDLWATFTKRPYIIVGALAFLMLIPLAVTSFRSAMKKVGRWWKPLHRLIYPAGVLVWLHFLWQARADIGEMVAYGLVLLVLLGLRGHWNGWGDLIPLRKTAR
ncbi:sulfite oxidase heme-binding subunit YedZ [Marinobacter fuscus]|nr:protein-methionine-sulfoxide reductase heme-binding subunit MsrQ [Marinobacter fuscus]